MNLYLPDTNIFIYAYHGEEPYATHLTTWISDDLLLISSIVAAEFLSGGENDERKRFEALIDRFGTIPIDTSIAKTGAFYRREFNKQKPGLKLPDALLAATCKLYNCILVSENPTDFPMNDIKKLSF